MKCLFKPTCLFFAFLVSISLSACSSDESTSEPVSDSTVATNTIEEPKSMEEVVSMEEYLEEEITEETQPEEEEKTLEWSWSPVPELEGMDVCGLVYSCRPYKEKYNAFYGSPVDERYYVIQNGDKFGLMNNEGEWIVDPIYAVVHYAYDYFFGMGYEWGDESYTLENGKLRRLEDVEYGWINGTSTDPDVEWNTETNSLIAYNSQLKIMDPNGASWIYDDHYDYPGTLATGIFETSGENYRFGIITNNQPVTDFIYDNATTFSDGLIAVKKDEKWGYLDSTGKEIIPCEYDGFRTTQNYYEFDLKYAADLSPEYYSEDMVNECINYWLSGRFAAACTDGYVVLCKDGEYGLFTDTYKEVIPFGTYEEISEVTDGRFFAKNEGVWGICVIQQ